MLAFYMFNYFNISFTYCHQAKTSSGRTRKSCQMCFNYELQLQSMQKKESSLMKQILSRKDDLQRGEKFRAELEDKFNEEAKNIEQEILLLQKRIESSSTEIIELRSMCKTNYMLGSNKSIFFCFRSA